LSNILFTISGQTLFIRATNLEIGVEGEINLETKVDSDTSFVIDAGLLKNFLQQVKNGGKTTIEISESSATFKTAKSEALIAIQDGGDFPTLPTIQDDHTKLSLPADEFVQGIISVNYASATSTMKPELSSIYIHTHNGELFFVATDTFRLAERVLPSRSFNDQISLLVPSANALELTKLIEPEDELELQFDSNLLQINQHKLKLTARVVDGNFPDYRQIIPAEFDVKATGLFHDLESALRLSSIFADKYYQVTLDFKDDSLILESKGSEQGKSITSVPVSIDGQNVESKFNQKYLIEPLSSLKGDNVVFELSPNKPMMMSNPADNTFRYLVMPMHQ
jgi:DNA polymerase-3 subunit beta